MEVPAESPGPKGPMTVAPPPCRSGESSAALSGAQRLAPRRLPTVPACTLLCRGTHGVHFPGVLIAGGGFQRA